MKDTKSWPLIWKLVATKRLPQDKGLGDTLEHFIKRVGGEKFKKMFKDVMGFDCGCETRKEEMNKSFPYES